MINQLIRLSLSCRRFYQNEAIKLNRLKSLVNLVRLSASTANLQPLAYILCCNTKTIEQIFLGLAWAAYLKNWPGPAEGERPAAYIVILGDTAITNKFEYDAGIACRSILLGAWEKAWQTSSLDLLNGNNCDTFYSYRPDIKFCWSLRLANPKEKSG